MNSEREALALRRRTLVAQARLQRLEIAGGIESFTARGARAYGLVSRVLSLVRLAATLLPLFRGRVRPGSDQGQTRVRSGSES